LSKNYYLLLHGRKLVYKPQHDIYKGISFVLLFRTGVELRLSV